MRILTDHTGAEQRQFGICSRRIGEETVEFLGKALLAYELFESLYIVLHRPHVVPAVALADVRCIFIRRVSRLETAVGMARLHERRTLAIHIAIVLGALAELFINVSLVHRLGKRSDASVVVGILKRTRKRPVVAECRFLHVVRHIAQLLVESDASIVVKVGCLDALCERLLLIYIRHTLQYSLSNDRGCMVTNHHIGLRRPHVPYRQASVLLAERNERIDHLACSCWHEDVVKRMCSAVGIPQRACLVVVPTIGLVQLAVGTEISAVYVAEQRRCRHGMIERSVEY